MSDAKANFSTAGHENEMGLIVTISAVVNIALNCILIALFGFTGAAISTAVTMVMWNVAMFIYVQHKLGINSTVISKG